MCTSTINIAITISIISTKYCRGVRAVLYIGESNCSAKKASTVIVINSNSNIVIIIIVIVAIVIVPIVLLYC